MKYSIYASYEQIKKNTIKSFIFTENRETDLENEPLSLLIEIEKSKTMSGETKVRIELPNKFRKNEERIIITSKGIEGETPLSFEQAKQAIVRSAI